MVFSSYDSKHDFSKKSHILNDCTDRKKKSCVNDSTDSESILGYEFRRNTLKIDGCMVFSSCDRKRDFRKSHIS